MARKPLVSLLIVCLFSACLSACSPKPAEIAVFAAASLTEAMDGIVQMYKKVAPHVTVTTTLDSSGTLKTQIQHGAECDIFLSASKKSMDQLDISADPSVNTEKLDFVVQNTRFDLVSNFCVLAVPNGNPAGVQGFADVATGTVSLIALGNSDVPAGQYARQILEHLGIWDQIQEKITFCSNVKEVTTQVAEQAVDCGVIYGTDAASAGLSWVEAATENMHTKVVYPVAVIKSSKNQKVAKAFIEYLKTKEVKDFLVDLGFSIPK